MHPVVLSLAIHNHQPVGNFDYVFADAADRAYAPMIAALERHPTIRLALHYSGPLLDWLRPHRPELLDRIHGLAGRGQVEVMTGGYYEPILAIIPDADKRGQIEKLTREIAAEFGTAADGLWLAERVWEPHLARPLGEAGVRYTIVDDTHFHAVGLDEPQLLGYYMTEEAGVPLAIFPSLKRLRYLVPWAPVEDVIAYLRTLADSDVRTDGRSAALDLAVMGDDGEKFGLWPGTYAHCWEHGWIDRFFAALEATPWIEVVPPGEYRRSREPAGRIYLPAATYDEMAEWALPADRAERLSHLKRQLEGSPWAEVLPFIRGGFWRHFLVKYAEVNTLHHLALRAGEKVAAMPPGDARARALEDLWAGECNCPYWHGVFGGVYLPHIRGAAFSHLVAAEAAAEAARHPGAHAIGDAADLNGDGRTEVRLATDVLVLTVDPGRGGSVVEWDYRPAPRHLGNVLTRRRERYHADLLRAVETGAAQAVTGEPETIHTAAVRVKEPGLERFLIYDRTRRPSLRMRLVPEGTTPEQCWRGEEDDLADLADGAYTWDLDLTDARASVRLHREGGTAGGRVVVDRTVEAQPGLHGLLHTTRLRWEGPAPLRAVAIEEWGIGVFGGPDDVWVEAAGVRSSLHDLGTLPPTARVTVEEAWSGLRLGFDLGGPAAIWTLPLFTISNSEGGYERNFQGAVLLICRSVELPPGGDTAHATRCTIAVAPR